MAVTTTESSEIESQEDTDDITSEAGEDTQESDNVREEDNGDITNLDDSELVSTGVPVIRLLKYKVHLPVGESFVPLAYVEAIDDKDEASRRIRVSSDYNMNEPGTYELDYYLIDSDGNQSNIEKLTLVVTE